MPCGFTTPSFSGCTRGLSEKPIVSLRAMTRLPLRRCASVVLRQSLPPRVGDVEDHVVRAGPLHLEVAVAAGSHGHVETGLLGEPLGLDCLKPLAGLAEVVHLEAEM